MCLRGEEIESRNKENGPKNKGLISYERRNKHETEEARGGERNTWVLLRREGMEYQKMTCGKEERRNRFWNQGMSEGEL